MSNVLDEMNDALIHYGTPRHSGRYEWGSGKDPYQHTRDFLSRIEELKKDGWAETPDNIEKEFGLTTTQYRAQKALAKDQRRMDDVARAKSLAADGLGATEIGKIMGKPESTIRSLLNPNSEARMMQAKETADFIREQIDNKGLVDVGSGVERELNISKEKLNQALSILESEGYVIQRGGIPQITNKGQQTITKVIGPPGTEPKEFYDFKNGEINIHTLKDYISHDDGITFDKFVYPKSMDSDRLMIRYKEDGGIEKDGVIELRRGVDDLDLGGSHYSQVRILVDDNRYLKGMAVYSDDMPPGVDVIFNTNKSRDVDSMDVLKKIKDDPDNPFGSLIKAGGQSYYIDKDGNKQLSLINKRADENDWTEWKNKLPAQFLSKQSHKMAEKQLNLALVDKRDEYEELLSLTNPTVKKHLLNKFADECDSAAVHLQAAALPGQKYHVILPVSSLKDTEVFAPGYPDGTKLALIRFPHGGTFEIPKLTVTSKNADAKKLIGLKSIDALCINSRVAERLSGADFDGDSVIAIPTDDKYGKVKITSTPPLKGLEGFDPKMSYPERPGMKYMKNTQTEMGKISNLITDMTLMGASEDKLARAVRHSMVVIDAEKHKLNYKQSEQDNNIASLKKEYQGGGGASTLISRSKGETQVLKRQGSPTVNIKGRPLYDPSRPEGVLLYKVADDVSYKVTKTNKRTGEVSTVTRNRHQKVSRMSNTDDAYTLVSTANTHMERLYADYANNMKSMANQARVNAATVGKIAYSKTAKAYYKPEVDSLMDKLNQAELNRPRERQAQLRANAEVNAKTKINPNLKKTDVKKASQQALTKARSNVGSVSRKDRAIKLTDREWDAIQAGAISENYLKKILNNADVDELRQRATPRTTTTLSDARVNRIKAMSNSNYSLSQIAEAVGVSTATVANYIKE